MEEGIYVRMYLAPLREGLLKELKPEILQTFIALVTFMDEQYTCYPTQERIAGLMGCSRVTANRRIQELCDFKWKGEPLVYKWQVRNDSGNFSHSVYRINPALFDIF